MKQLNKYIILAGSVAALAFAFYFQYLKGLKPCELCIFQRWGYALVILFALITLKKESFKYLVSLALALEVAIAAYHVGIEQHWWEGFTSCSSSFGSGTLDEIRAKIMSSPLVRCDEPQWRLAGLSMAAWNAIYATGLLVISRSLWRKSTS